MGRDDKVKESNQEKAQEKLQQLGIDIETFNLITCSGVTGTHPVMAPKTLHRFSVVMD